MNNTIKLLVELVSSTSVERTIDCLIGQFSSLGFTVKKLHFNGVDNLYACKNLQKTQNTILYLGHADVVPLGEGWTFEQGAVADGAVWGRGAVDMKGSIACFIEALRLNPDASVEVIISGDEEGSAEFGTPAVLAWMRQNQEGAFPRFDFALIGEPTSCNLTGDTVKVGCRGSLNVELIANGTAGHVAYPQFLNNPITQLVYVLNEITTPQFLSDSEYNLEMTSFESDSGATNVVPAVAHCRFNIRFSAELSGQKLIAAIDKSAKKHNIHAKYDIACEPFFSKRMDDVANKTTTTWQLLNAVQSVTCRTPQMTTGGANSDAKFLYEIVPFAEIGLKVELAHKCNECVSFDDLDILTRIYDKFFRALTNETSPFEVLEYPATFSIDEAILRKNYFEKCRQYRDDTVRLELAHKSYRILLDPGTRLDCLMSALFPSDSQADTPHLDDDIIILHNEFSTASAESLDTLLAKVNALNQSLLPEIQTAFDQKDQRRLRKYRNKLSYYKKFKEMAQKL
ncbi:MAG: succinyl-diaminopimelate desuccinylase [Holosporales bacterium]|nr:succinyl-diaminopimelate desuccinylase [Holosporales bacterium]